jgi:uncharacterized protein (TIGR02588 family)
MAAKAERKAAPSRKAPHTPVVEWIAAGLSTAMVLGVIGFLVYDGVRSPATPPNVTIEVDSIVPAGPGYLVLFRAQNRSRSTAAEVLVEGELQADGGNVETSETTLDYVPAKGLERGGLYFAHDPRRGQLRLKAKGYREP